ncbi:MAG: hypothetical protein WCO56_22745 [Verrucomicrobiota bacterium]
MASERMNRYRKQIKNGLAALAALSVMFMATGCVGLAHSGSTCCRDIPGKYYRATRVDMIAIKEKPLLTPLVIGLDLPFALVVETIQIPFILTDVLDPRPAQLELRPQSPSQKPVEDDQPKK